MEIVDQMENKAYKQGLTIRLDKEYKHPIFVHADSERIYRVLMNLISNAIKYTDEGEVVVALEVTGEKVEVAIKDTGVGISPDH